MLCHTRSRKLNSQLERAIQEAMADLDRRTSKRKPKATSTSSLAQIMSSETNQHQSVVPSCSTSPTSTSSKPSASRPRTLRPSPSSSFQPVAHPLPLRNRPVKIAPAPPSVSAPTLAASTVTLSVRPSAHTK